jgi:tryptophan synthase alpha chain
VAKSASGWIYAVARLGVTGARTDVPPEIGELVARVRKFSSIPICAGFGFSEANQIRQTVAETGVDGIVVASALIDRFEKATGDAKQRIESAASYARELKAATVAK